MSNRELPPLSKRWAMAYYPRSLKIYLLVSSFAIIVTNSIQCFYWTYFSSSCSLASFPSCVFNSSWMRPGLKPGLDWSGSSPHGPCSQLVSTITWYWNTIKSWLNYFKLALYIGIYRFLRTTTVTIDSFEQNHFHVWGCGKSLKTSNKKCFHSMGY